MSARVGLACPEDTWAVGHLKNIGHVAGGGAVEYGDLMSAGFDQVKHGDNEYASVECHGLTRFEIHFDIVTLAEAFNHTDESFDIVARTGDVMAAAEVEPFKSRNEVSKFRFKGFCGMLQRVSILLAERVEVETIELAN